MAAFPKSLLLAFCLSAPAAATPGQAFLGQDALHHSHVVADLLQELERVAGPEQREATERRVTPLVETLRPMYLAMPKDVNGDVHATSARYLLHRLFVQRHGWFVNGLDAAGGLWNESSPAAMFKNHADGQIHSAFEATLSDRPFSLHQIGVMAATLETMVHEENVERLQAAYRVLGLSELQEHGEEDASAAMRAYMVMFVMNINHTEVTPVEYAVTSENLVSLYPTWPDTDEFVQQVRRDVLEGIKPAERTYWSSTLRVLEEVGERYGRWQDKECHVLKSALVSLDSAGIGRVPLDKFYAKALSDENMQFLESMPYLRQSGALDESDPRRPSVILSNYINSPSNCVASSKFYSVCCINECEELLGNLEVHIGAEEAAPLLIAQLVSGMASQTVKAPRQLDATLLRRLDEIADYHGQVVPLHGRLFSQWMHHAFPRECPYPHVSGTTAPLTAEAYMGITGNEVEVSPSEMRDFISNARQYEDLEEQAVPWTEEEELFVHSPPATHRHGGTGSIGRGLALLGCSASFALYITRRFSKEVTLLVDPSGQHKYHV